MRDELGLTVRIRSLIVIAVACAGCCATPSTNPAAHYIVTLGIYPDKSCVFVSTAEIPKLNVVADLRPPDAFLKVACRYFLATYQTQAPAGEPSSTEGVGWYTNNPDIPRYIPHVEM